MYKYKIVPDVGPRLVMVVSEPEKGYSLYSYRIEWKRRDFVMKIAPGAGTITSNGIDEPPSVNPMFTFEPGKAKKKVAYRYYISKDPEGYAVDKMWSDTYGRGEKYFKERISEIFEECPELLNKVEQEEFHSGNIPKMIEFFNRHCPLNSM